MWPAATSNEVNMKKNGNFSVPTVSNHFTTKEETKEGGYKQFLNFSFSIQTKHSRYFLYIWTRFNLKTVFSAQFKNQRIEQRNELKRKLDLKKKKKIRTRHYNF